MNSATSTIEQAISVDLERMFQNRFFRALERGSIPLTGLKVFAAEYYSASNGFPDILAVACSRLGTDELRLAVVQNLWDEHGQGNIRRSHRALLRKFLDYLNVLPQLSTRDGGPAGVYVGAMIELCRESTPAGIFGALGPGCEYFTPREYQLISGALKMHFRIPDDALEFFLDHIHHDDFHIDAFNEALQIAVRDGQELANAIEGARRSLSIEFQFWEHMHSLCINAI